LHKVARIVHKNAGAVNRVDLVLWGGSGDSAGFQPYLIEAANFWS
jgi:hypothetical protein